MNDVVVNVENKLAQLELVIADQLDAGELCLFQNDISPTENTPLASFTEADFTGYAPATITLWGDAFIDDTGAPTVLGGLQVFAATGSAITNMVYGCFYKNVGGDLVWAARFDTPLNFAADGNTLAMVPKYQLGEKAA